MTTEKRKCWYCNRHKLPHLFHADQLKLKNKAPICKSCRKKHSESYRNNRDAYYRRTYNITVDEYEALLAYQGGKCAVCRKKPGKRRLAVDHDHRVEERSGSRSSIRGLLCRNCNEYLGHIGDSLLSAQLLSDYLRIWPSTESGVLQ